MGSDKHPSLLKPLKMHKSFWLYENRLQARFNQLSLADPFTELWLDPICVWRSLFSPPQIYTEHFDIPPSVGTFSEHLPAKFHPLLPAKERKLQPHLLDAELICCLASLQILRSNSFS